MNDHVHDFELIMALAEGMLDPSDAARVEADVAACPACAQDLEFQRTALEVLAEAEAVSLTDIERTRLHRAVERQLAPAITRRRAVETRWFRWAAALSGAAAVLIAVVAIGVTVGGSDDADDFAMVGAATESPTTELRALAPAEVQDAAEGSEFTTQAPGFDEDVASLLQRYSAGLSASDEPPDLTLLATQLTAQLQSEEPEAPTESMAAGTASEPDVEAFDPETCRSQADELGADLGSGILVGVWDFDGVGAAVVAYVDPEGTVVVLAHDLETCEVIARS